MKSQPELDPDTPPLLREHITRKPVEKFPKL